MGGAAWAIPTLRWGSKKHTNELKGIYKPTKRASRNELQLISGPNRQIRIQTNLEAVLCYTILSNNL